MLLLFRLKSLAARRFLKSFMPLWSRLLGRRLSQIIYDALDLKEL